MPEPIPDHLRDYVGSRLRKQGLFALDDADLINLLCIPPFSFDTDVETAVWGVAVQLRSKPAGDTVGRSSTRLDERRVGS